MTDTAQDPAAGPPQLDPDRLTPELIKIGIVITFGTFVAQMDGTMVNVALDTLRKQFRTDVSTIQWTMTGYLLAMAVVIPFTGWAINRFGPRSAWVWSLVIFLVGSVLSAVAWNAESLIGFRLVQGVGGGMMLPLSQAILASEAGPKRLGKLMAVIGLPSLLGPVVGPAVGGLIVQDLNWRWIFYINIPICLLSILLALRVMEGGRAKRGMKLDIVGLLLLSPGLVALVYALARAGTAGSFDNTEVVAYLSVGAFLIAAYIWHARRRGAAAVIDLQLLRARNFTAASVMMFLVSATLIGAMLLLPLYYQQVRDQSVLDTGLLLMPQGAGMAVAIPVAGGLIDKYDPRPFLISGLLMLALGTGALTQVGAHTSMWVISGALVLRGAGFGAVMVPAMAVCYRGLRRDEIPAATSAIRVFQQIGGSLGVALFAVTLQRQITSVFTSAHGRPTIDAVAGAFGNTYWWVTGALILSVLPLLFISGGGPGEVIDGDLAMAEAAGEDASRP